MSLSSRLCCTSWEGSEVVEMALAEELISEPGDEIQVSPYDLPGDWYVIHAYSGHEEKVKANLEKRVELMRFTDRIFDVAYSPRGCGGDPQP